MVKGPYVNKNDKVNKKGFKHLALDAGIGIFEGTGMDDNSSFTERAIESFNVSKNPNGSDYRNVEEN